MCTEMGDRMQDHIDEQQEQIDQVNEKKVFYFAIKASEMALSPLKRHIYASNSIRRKI